MSQNRVVKPELAGGFNDYPPALQIQRADIVRRIQNVYERFGYDPLETPAVERTRVLTGGRTDIDKLLYRTFPARGARWPRREPDQSVCLRFDLTVPLARFVAANPDLPKPFRRYQVGNVWRGEKPQLGRFREFLQFDVDIVGSASPMADAEMIMVMDAVMREIGFERYRIRVNSRKIMNALALKGGFDAPEERPAEVIRVLDKLDGLGRDAVLAELGRDPDGEEPGVGLTPDQVDLVGRYLDVSGGIDSVLDALTDLLGDVPLATEGVAELREVAANVRAAGVSDDVWAIDPSVARGLDYYTGPVWETVLLDCPEIGSVAGGGRYDGLVSRFMRSATLPCTGTAVGVDRLFAAMESLGMIQSAGTVTEVLIVNFVPELGADYQDLARRLRDASIRTAIYLGEDRSFKAQISYAARQEIPIVLIFGPDDRDAGVVQVKDMRARTQEAVALGEVVGSVKSVLAGT